MSQVTDPFDCDEFYALCVDLRLAIAQRTVQKAYTRLQAYCRAQRNTAPVLETEYES